MVSPTHNPSTWAVEAEDHKLEAILDYLGNYRKAWATEQELVFPKQTPTNPRTTTWME